MEQNVDRTWYLDLGEPSHLINSKKFFSNFHSGLEHEKKFMKNKANLAEKLTEEQYNTITETCSVPQDNEISNQCFIDPTIFSIDLQEMLNGLPLASLKYNRVLNKNEKIIEEGTNEIIYSVAFYNQGKPSSRMQEYLVLGSQPLSILRDVFYCIRDFYKPENNIGGNLNVSLNNEERKNPSSYFFIEDVFYNDLRELDAIDYSKHQEPGLALYHSARMEKTLFRDLSIKLNKPYLFLHQDDCQHAVVFRDIRVVAINDFLAGETPSYFCEVCYDLFHYDENNKLLYDNFEVII
ncbi:2097_t:CDS:2 [Entrophospora sp. SA101]|nr:2097_t:CDS:2 [Entrophospora sp. SA101]